MAMNIERYVPAEILRPFVKTLMILESENGVDNRLLPDTSIALVFRLRGGVTQDSRPLPSSALNGLRRSSRYVGYSQSSAVLLALFQEGAAAAFFREPLHTLFGESAPLDNFIPRRKLDEVEGRLADLSANRRRIDLVERFLISEMRAPDTDGLVREAVRRIQRADGNLRIRDLASGLHISQDPLEKRFRKAVGSSPKQFSSIVRLKSVIDSHTVGVSLSESAHAAGYFDQAHFIKDFRLFTGQAPGEFFQSPRLW